MFCILEIFLQILDFLRHKFSKIFWCSQFFRSPPLITDGPQRQFALDRPECFLNLITLEVDVEHLFGPKRWVQFENIKNLPSPRRFSAPRPCQQQTPRRPPPTPPWSQVFPEFTQALGLVVRSTSRRRPSRSRLSCAARIVSAMRATRIRFLPSSGACQART